VRQQNRAQRDADAALLGVALPAAAERRNRIRLAGAAGEAHVDKTGAFLHCAPGMGIDLEVKVLL